MRGNTAIRWSWTRRIRKTRRRRCSTGALLWISPRRWWMLITPNQASRLLRYRLLLQPQHPSRARLTDRRRTEARITRDGLVLSGEAVCFKSASGAQWWPQSPARASLTREYCFHIIPPSSCRKVTTRTFPAFAFIRAGFLNNEDGDNLLRRRRFVRGTKYLRT